MQPLSRLRNLLAYLKGLGGIFILTLASMLGCFRNERSAEGTYSFDVTGNEQAQGHYAGIATSSYPAPLSSASSRFGIALRLNRPPMQGVERSSLMFSFDTMPGTGVINLKADLHDVQTGVPRPVRARLAGNSNHGIFAWDASDGELRIDADSSGGSGLRGEFSMTLVQTLGGPATNTMKITGRFETH